MKAPYPIHNLTGERSIERRQISQKSFQCLNLRFRDRYRFVNRCQLLHQCVALFDQAPYVNALARQCQAVTCSRLLSNFFS